MLRCVSRRRIRTLRTDAFGSIVLSRKWALMTSRCSDEEVHAVCKSNLEDDQVIYDRRIAFSFLLPLSASFQLSPSRDAAFFFFFAVSFSPVPLASIALERSRRTRYPSKREAGCCRWWDKHQVATSHSPFIPVTPSRTRERRRTTNCNLHNYRDGVYLGIYTAIGRTVLQFVSADQMCASSPFR